MLFINHLDKNQWWEFDKEKMIAFNYSGGYNYVNEESLVQAEICEYQDWHELYLAKHFCPLEVDIKWGDVWISPEGIFYNGDAHENRAEEILEIMYGETDVPWTGDRLEELGWIRATRTLMWDVRFDEWVGKTITQKQYDALWDWCEHHKRKFPKGINVR